MLSDEVRTLKNKTLLLVEDDATIAEVLTYNLKLAGYDVIQERDGRAGLSAALTYDVDLVLMDLMLPELDGMAASREIARRRPHLPILILTARRDRGTMLEGYEAGADDFVTKPFDLDELLAKIAARLRRADTDAAQPLEQQPSTPVVFDLTIGTDAHELHGPAGLARLNPKEHDLLQLLLSQPGHLFPREELVQRVWHQQYIPSSRTLDVHIRHLRVKLGEVGSAVSIGSVRGVGYRVESPR